MFCELSHARQATPLQLTRRSTSTSKVQRRQHQKRPYSVGYSSALSSASSHVWVMCWCVDDGQRPLLTHTHTQEKEELNAMSPLLIVEERTWPSSRESSTRCTRRPPPQ